MEYIFLNIYHHIYLQHRSFTDPFVALYPEICKTSYCLFSFRYVYNFKNAKAVPTAMDDVHIKFSVNQYSPSLGPVLNQTNLFHILIIEFCYVLLNP